MEVKRNKRIMVKHRKYSSTKGWRAPSPEENNQHTIYDNPYIWETNPNGPGCWKKFKNPKKLRNPVPTNVSISNSKPSVATAIESTYSTTTHEANEVQVFPTEVQGFPWTPDDLSNHLTTAAIAAAVSSTLNPLLDDNTASTVATSITEDNIKEPNWKRAHQSAIKEQTKEIHRIQLQMDGLMLDNSLKIYNQTKRSLSSDPSLSYEEPGAEPNEFNFIYKRVGYIQKRLKTQNYFLPKNLTIDNLNEVGDIQEEINTINTDFSVL